MSDKIMWAYYNGMTVEQAIKFCTVDGVKPTDRVIKNAIAKVKKLTGNDWN